MKKNQIFCNKNFFHVMSSLFMNESWYSFPDFEVKQDNNPMPHIIFNGNIYQLAIENYNKSKNLIYSSKFFPINYSFSGNNVLPFALPRFMDDIPMTNKYSNIKVLFDVENKNYSYLKKTFDKDVEFINTDEVDEGVFDNEGFFVQCISNDFLRFLFTYYLGYKNLLNISLGERDDYFGTLKFLNVTNHSQLVFFVKKLPNQPSYFLNLLKKFCNEINTQTNISYLKWLNENI